MDESAAVESLERLGLTGYEAKVFIALQKLGDGTARDVDRIADVPRSQVYSAAENLEDRGLVEVQQSNPIRYRPVSIEAARSTLRDRFEREQDRAFEYVEDVREQHSDGDEEQEDIWTVRGQDRVTDRIVELVADADDHVLFGAPHVDLLPPRIADALRQAADDGLRVAVVSDNEAVRDRFADDDGVVATAPPPAFRTDSSAGRVVHADDDAVLISVLGEESIPEINRETAFWSRDTNFASVLVQIMQSSIGPFDD
ncbi:TrmB family transcriptional regulator [Halostella litorea]|uniref:TrmB family transcriptional regulator n=1 Tax=Halostella litorea TaxID=2528831 RepID=UPI00109231E7|nr:helix-turn-helix domain-containing protein [Halostella litorea]